MIDAGGSFERELTPLETDRWDVTAVRYATRDTSKADCYLGYEMYGEADEPLAMDYYFYVLSNGSRNLLVDTGFALEAGTRRGRTCIVPPLEALARLGFAAESISEVLITHFHYDHIGNVAAFPDAELLVSDRELAFWTGPLADRPHFAAYVEATGDRPHRRGASRRARSVPRRARKRGAGDHHDARRRSLSGSADRRRERH